MATATRSREFEMTMLAKSIELACNMAAKTAGFAFAKPCPNCESIDFTHSRKYVSAVIGACRIKVSALAVIVDAPKTDILAQEGGAA
jgi:hypothetical protein